MTSVVLGNATLILADSRDWLATLPDAFRVEAVVMDPPYGVNLTAKTNDFRDSKFFDDGASLQASVTYDDSPEHVETLIRDVVQPVLTKTDRAAIFPGSRMMFSYPRPDSVGGVYVPNGAGRDRWGFGCFQPILYYGKCPYLARGQGSRPNAFSDNQPGEQGIDHPCPKPIKWMVWLVNRVSFEDETVLDPFMGSGTTGIACANLGRKFLGIEAEPKYFEIACQRIDQAQRQHRLFP